MDFETQEGSPQTDYSFILGLDTSSLDITSLRPPRETRLRLWEVFKENVEPVTKVFHMPTMEPKIFEALQQDQRPFDGIEAICFSAYLGAVTSLTSQECESIFHEDRSVLCSRYLLGVERVLAKCRLTSTDDLQVLQAFILYLVLLRNHKAHLSWQLTGLAARIGHSLGLHREGDFGISLFEMEMRRRLWWYIAILEAPASEDYSSEYMV